MNRSRSSYSDNSVTTRYNNVTLESEGQDMNLGKETETLEFNGNNTPYSAAGRYYLRPCCL